MVGLCQTISLAFIALSVHFIAHANAGHLDSLTDNGWLILHQCASLQTPPIRGDNLMAGTQFNPVTAADDVKTNLKAVFTKGTHREKFSKTLQSNESQIRNTIRCKEQIYYMVFKQ